MLTIYGFNSFNPFKVVATAEELGLDYDYKFVNLGKQENTTAAYAGKHPFGKVPALEHDGHCIAESAAICRYLARISDNKLYSSAPAKAAEIDSILDIMNIHIGRWMANYFWQEIVCPTYFDKAPDQDVLAEAKGWLDKQLPAIEQRLSENQFICGDEITLADPFALAYFMIKEQTSIDISAYPDIERWYAEMLARPAIQKANKDVYNAQ